jgi:hypothetical protein
MCRLLAAEPFLRGTPRLVLSSAVPGPKGLAFVSIIDTGELKSPGLRTTWSPAKPPASEDPSHFIPISLPTVLHPDFPFDPPHSAENLVAMDNNPPCVSFSEFCLLSFLKPLLIGSGYSRHSRLLSRRMPTFSWCPDGRTN